MRPWFHSHLSLNKEQASSLVAALLTAYLLGTTMLRLRTRVDRNGASNSRIFACNTMLMLLWNFYWNG